MHAMTRMVVLYQPMTGVTPLSAHGVKDECHFVTGPHRATPHNQPQLNHQMYL